MRRCAILKSNLPSHRIRLGRFGAEWSFRWFASGGGSKVRFRRTSSATDFYFPILTFLRVFAKPSLSESPHPASQSDLRKNGHPYGAPSASEMRPGSRPTLVRRLFIPPIFAFFARSWENNVLSRRARRGALASKTAMLMGRERWGKFSPISAHL